MLQRFKHDIFISYNERDLKAVRDIANGYRDRGLRPFVADRELRGMSGQPEWEDRIMEELVQSQDLALYCSADALKSQWVQRELEVFSQKCATIDPQTRRIHIIRPDEVTQDQLDLYIAENSLLKTSYRQRTADELMKVLVSLRIDRLQEEIKEVEELHRKAFEYYKFRRFWHSFVNDEEGVSIFACGRDAPKGSAQISRTTDGGRTNIDVWDYRSAIDFTQYFAKEHPAISVTIEDPVPKDPMEETKRRFDSSKYTDPLNDRHCIVIGSPDVSDYAEMALARIIGVDPYEPEIDLHAGFRIFKSGTSATSTFYREEDNPDAQRIEIYDPSEGGRVREFPLAIAERQYVSYGVLVVANNPCRSIRSAQRRRPEPRKRILITAGFSGVATQALALLLTSDVYIDRFEQFNQEFAGLGEAGECIAVVKVIYEQGRDYDARDTRRIDDIQYEGLVPIRAPRPHQ